MSVSMANLSCLLATTLSNTGTQYTDTGTQYTDTGTQYTDTGTRYTDTGTRYTDTGTRYIDTGTFLSNSFSSPRFNLLRVAWRRLSLSSATDNLFFFLLYFFVFFLLYLFRVLSSAFLSSVLQSLKLYLL